MKWWHISILLCTYGFFKEFRPSGPFLTPFLTEFKNLTIQQVNEEMFPVHIYSHLILLVVVFLLTDFLRYKPVLIVGSISGVLVWSIIAWGKTLLDMQIAETIFGLYLSCEVAYYTYMYAKVNKQHYQKVTSHARAAFLLGKATSSILSQVLVQFGFTYLHLNYLSIFGLACTIPLGFLLPSVPRSLYFYRGPSKTNEKNDGSITIKSNKVEEIERPMCTREMFSAAFKILYTDFKESFTNVYVLKWSLWWALATCGYLQVTAYIQLVWQEIIEKKKDVKLYHGYVEFVGALLGSLVSFGVGYVNIPWHIWGETSLGILSLLQGGVVLYLAYIYDLYTSYAIDVVFRIMYDAGITVATFQVARFINEDAYALVLGIDNFAALIGQTLLTAIVIDAMRLNIRLQFQIYSYYFFSLGFGFLLYGVYKVVVYYKHPKEENPS